MTSAPHPRGGSHVQACSCGFVPANRLASTFSCPFASGHHAFAARAGDHRQRTRRSPALSGLRLRGHRNHHSVAERGTDCFTKRGQGCSNPQRVTRSRADRATDCHFGIQPHPDLRVSEESAAARQWIHRPQRDTSRGSPSRRRRQGDRCGDKCGSNGRVIHPVSRIEY